MDIKRQTVQVRWLESRLPSQRTGREALVFSNECWASGLRLAANQRVHDQLVMQEIRWTLIR